MAVPANDIYRKPEKGNDWYFMHLLPTHSFYKVKLEGDSLQLVYISPDVFEEKFEHDIPIQHERLGDDAGDTTVLTAPTQELQEFVLKYIGDENVFHMVMEFHRQKHE